MLQTIKIVVKGRVQGVFFRQGVRDTAQKLGLVGYVKNIPDGSVEIMATGEKPVLARLLRWAQKGSEAARVDEVDSEILAGVVNFEGFEIKY